MLVSCKRRNNRRNQIHGVELRIQAIRNRRHVQCSQVIVCVVFDTGRFVDKKVPRN